MLGSGSLDEALRRWSSPGLTLVKPAAVALLIDQPVANDDAVPARRRRWAALSALAAAIVFGVLIALPRQFPAHPAPVYLETARAASRTEALADGSVVHLDAETRIVVELAEDARAIRLDAGRALVEVAPDKERPLTVSSGDVDATAIGTAFSVDRYDGGVTVRVEHGRVKVRRGAWSGFLNAGEGSRLAQARAPEMLRFKPSTDLATDDAWLRAINDRLGEIVARLQRRTAVRLTDNLLVSAMLAVAEQEVTLFSPPLRRNAARCGINVKDGYYFVHGTSADDEADAADDDHERDLWLVVTQALLPPRYGEVSELALRYCDLWMQFWDRQLLFLDEFADTSIQ